MGLALVIALAILQGVTEFLPVSSSGHLRLLAAMFDVADPQTLFDIILHVGTLIPVVIVYRGELYRMTLATLRVLRAPRTLGTEADARLVLLVGLATVPTAAIGLLLGGAMEAVASDIKVVGGFLLLNGCILLTLGAFQRRQARPDTPTPRGLGELTVKDALIIGTLQGFAIFRGVSRSGTTITAALMLGIEQEAAAALSFLLAIPAICGALVLKFDAAALTGDAAGLYLVGGLVAAVSGTIALLLLLRLLRRGHLHHFAWYCFALGALAIGWGLQA